MTEDMEVALAMLEEAEILNPRQWTIEDGTYLRTVSNYTEDFFCPITATMHTLTGGYYPTHQFPFAAGDLGIPPAIADKIANAADNHSDMAIRARLLEIYGVNDDNQE